MIEVSIVGAGAVGLAIASALRRAGVGVEVIVRETRRAELSQRGLWVKSPHCSVQRIDAPVEATVSESSRLILLTPKTFALSPAVLAHCDGRGGETTVVALQNGVGADAILRERAPKVVRLGGVVSFSATSLLPGEVEVRSDGGRLSLGLGAADAGVNAELEASAAWALLARGLDLMHLPDLAASRWTKLIVNLNNGLFAATGLSARRFYAHQYGAWLAVETMREGLRVAKAGRIRLGRIPMASPALMGVLAAAPTPLAVSLFRRQAAKALAEEADIYGSTLQSLRRREPTEIDDLNGEIARLAPSVGKAVPLNELIVRAVKAQGRGESPIGVDALVQAAVAPR